MNVTNPFTGNSFCPTGKGGGVDPTCSKGGTGGSVGGSGGSVFSEPFKDEQPVISGGGFDLEKSSPTSLFRRPSGVYRKHQVSKDEHKKTVRAYKKKGMVQIGKTQSERGHAETLLQFPGGLEKDNVAVFSSYM